MMLPSAPSRITRIRRSAGSGTGLARDVDPLVPQQPVARLVLGRQAEDLDPEAGLRQPIGEIEAVVALVVLVAEMDRAQRRRGDRRALIDLAARLIDRRAQQRRVVRPE